MTDKDEDETEESTNKLTPGNILSFGSLNLILTLNLEKHDIKKYKIKFDKLESLENLKFLKKHKSLWKKVTLSSPNNTMNILLHINKSSKKIINIGYVAFKKIEYNDEQEEFEKFIKEVTTQNGLFLTSCEVCPCTIFIQLLLKFEEKEKKFVLCGKSESEEKEKEVKGEDDNVIQDEHTKENKEENKENKEEEKKSEKSKKEDENPFTKIKSEIVAPADFNYIYFNYNDYVNGEFKGKITVEHLYEYFQTLKITTKSKIILNLEQENIDNNNIFRDIMSITDIFIFYDKNKLYELLKQIKIEEDNYKTEKLYEYHCKEYEKKLQSREEFKQHEDEKIKSYKLFLEKNKTRKEKEKDKNKNINKTRNNDNKTRNNESQYKQNNTDIKKDNIYITQAESNKNKDNGIEINNINEMISNQEEEKEKEEKRQKREEQEKEKQQKDKKEENQNKKKEEENKEKQEENKEKQEENKEKQEENKEKQEENKENQGENKKMQEESKEKQEEKLDEQKGKPEEKEKEEKLKPSNITKAEPSNDGQDKEKLNNDKKSDILKTKPSKEEQDKEKLNGDKKSDILKTQPSNNEQDKGKINNEQKSDILIRDTITRKSNSLSKKKNLLPITPSAPQPLDKNDMFDYFKLGICDRDPQRRSTEKLLLLFDEFKKIFFVKYNRNNIKPNISDFDLKLYPQMNVRNMKEILEFKKFMKSKFSEYIKIFMGTLLSIVVVESKEKIDDDTLFLGYLCATNTVKKLAEIQKYNLPLPKEKEFFYPSINKNEVEKIISRANQRKKEKSFILDGNSKNPNVIKPYNPLLDKNLNSFFNSQNNKNFLKINGFIKQNGEINYDPIYRETLGFSKFGKDDKDVNKSFQTTNKFLVGYKRQSKGYSIYNENKSSAVVLPPIEQNKRKPAEEKNGNTINEEENESGSGSGGSGSGSGSGSGDDSGSGSGSGSGD